MGMGVHVGNNTTTDCSTAGTGTGMDGRLFLILTGCSTMGNGGNSDEYSLLLLSFG
jgi:hypothetical protein